jgi:uncharacterized protein (DUF952 family)
MRWLYHVCLAETPAFDCSGLSGCSGQAGQYAPASFAAEGFIHASFLPEVAESARLYFPADARLQILQIDPRAVRYEVVTTPRGPMPHVLEPIPQSAIIARLRLADLPSSPDELV